MANNKYVSQILHKEMNLELVVVQSNNNNFWACRMFSYLKMWIFFLSGCFNFFALK